MALSVCKYETCLFLTEAAAKVTGQTGKTQKNFTQHLPQHRRAEACVKCYAYQSGHFLALTTRAAELLIGFTMVASCEGSSTT